MSDATRLARHRLARTLRAGARGIVLHTDEDVRALAIIEDVGRELTMAVHTWSVAGGIDGDRRPRALVELLAELHTHTEEAIWVLFDAAAVCDERGYRALREVGQHVGGPAIVVVQPHGDAAGRRRIADMPEWVNEELVLPDHDELAARVHAIAAALTTAWPDAPSRLAAVARELADAGLGLTAHAFERVLAEAIVDHSVEGPALVAFVRAAKPGILAAGGLVETVAATAAEAVGGLAQLKAWLARRRVALTPAATAAGIPTPRGCLLVGVQGCGKSLAARACASVLGLPLVRLEPGRLFGGTVGESEANLRRATAIIDRLAPAVLWIDELDKGVAGSEGAASDAGTAARVLGGLLTWLQERTRPVFVVATANRIDALPPELLRRGRFDEVFFVDLPDAREREEILRVHLGRAGQPGVREVSIADAWASFAAVAHGAEGRSGAELAAAVAEARLVAFAEGRALAAADFARALAESIPLSVLRREDVAALRRWALERARRA